MHDEADKPIFDTVIIVTDRVVLDRQLQGTVAQFEQTAGVVKKIDAGAGKITLTSGPIKSLDMDEDNMTMVFRLKDPAMLKQVKVGDKVQFEAGLVDGQIAVTSLQKSK